MQDYDGTEKGYDWVVAEMVNGLYATPLVPRGDAEGDRILVRDAGARYAAVLTLTEIPGDEPGSLTVLVNGELLDFGDDLPVILGLFDEVYESALGGEEIFLPAVEN